MKMCTGTSAEEEELCDLTVDLLCLSQELVDAKLRLENSAKVGWLLVAKARYVMGPNTVGQLQLPAAGDAQQVVTALKRIDTQECLRQGWPDSGIHF